MFLQYNDFTYLYISIYIYEYIYTLYSTYIFIVFIYLCIIGMVFLGGRAGQRISESYVQYILALVVPSLYILLFSIAVI